ncbi:polyphosphate kinase 1 [Petrotoga sp. 9PWA.NaAc.5.4]|uniref:polyphosphate kinase 1 n=1 Tax=Petrotoga sp. 9PWA.NaAc.5.4 TaxID=1434328 RepID=UPI000CBBF661|nr:polyphosphate kinase 1 [Petrotoga sp. 9PWA.NaAc.5.4]PNR95336.1 polyphosphate kinase [Petrotoga sp. 9PWA.NaAc.5.4]
MAKSNNKKEKDKKVDLDDYSLYTNRELSWLDFNFRVLEEAYDKENPLLERFKFLAITSSNLEEFFMIRVAGLEEQVRASYSGLDISGLTPTQQLILISQKVNKMLEMQYVCLIDELLPLLKKENIRLLKSEELDEKDTEFLDSYFKTTVFPVVTPMAVDQSRPFPILPGSGVNLGVELQNEKGETLFAFIPVPTIFPRFIKLNSENGLKLFLIEDLIKKYSGLFFSGYKIVEMSEFRITRDGDFSIDEDDARDLLIEIQSSLKERRTGFPVKLEISKNMGKNLKNFLLNILNVRMENVYEISSFLDLSSLMEISNLEGYEHLKYEHYSPQPSIEFYGKEDIFKIISEKDVLLHHPYESFEHVVEFLRQACEDPQVLAIKQTLYRVGKKSPIIDYLIKAAENGKQVTVVVEVKARFDEENNIQWAKELEKAGCHVVYGLVGLKVHAKLLMVVRKEESGIKRYIHMSTGNYNYITTRLYEDIGFFTCKESYAQDVSALFNVLTGYSRPPTWKKLSVAPTTLKEMLIKLIENEIEISKKGGKGKIIIKANSLLDKNVIKVLYKASMNKVDIKLIIRGICSLKVGIKGISDNIKVRSIVGRYLEHSRIYYFENNGDPKLFISSADLMPRNLERRVETLIPIEQENLKQNLIDILQLYLKDNFKARELQPTGEYLKVSPKKSKIISVQDELMKESKKKFQKFLKKQEVDQFNFPKLK